jgi:hypothetical protein
MKIEEHPGYLGWTSKGVIAIHANWPTYPAEHGAEIALIGLGQFPPDTVFRQIDDIDQCFLFLAGKPFQPESPFDERNFHVAAWREDIVDLYRAGHVTGATEITLADWIERRCKELEGLVYLTKNGTSIPIPKPDLSDFEEDELEGLVLLIKDDGLKVTPSGWEALQKTLITLKSELHPLIVQRANPIAELGHYDAAVREACVILESRLKDISGLSDFGKTLIAKSFDLLMKDGRLITASLKVLRTEMMTSLKFVRNDFMHNVKDIERDQCWSILARISRPLFSLDEIEEVLSEEGTPNTIGRADD